MLKFSFICTCISFFVQVAKVSTQSLPNQPEKIPPVWAGPELGYDTSRIRPHEIFITLINKSGRRANIYQSDPDGTETFYRFTIRPNERKTLSFFPDSSFFEAFDFLTKRDLFINGYRRLETDRLYTGYPNDAFITAYNLPPEFNPNSKSPPAYIETLVMVDPSMIKYHGENVENFTMTIMNMVTRVYMHKSLNIPLYISVTKFVKMEVSPPNYNIEANNPSSSVEVACEFANTFFNDNYTFDFVLILTRENIGPAGYALMYTMCSKGSCALVKEDGFDTAFTIAHELGHSLGIDHDEGPCALGSSPTIMARKILATSANYMWSECSRRILKENLNYFLCLANVPKLITSFQDSMMNLPGESISLDNQCKVRYGDQSVSCTTESKSYQTSVCKHLWCHPKYSAPCVPLWSLSPLEGTTCDQDKWCINSACIVKKKEFPVHGGWSQWSDYTPPCDNSTKSLLIQQRTRSCTNPKPKFNGNPCKGISSENRAILSGDMGACIPYTFKKLTLDEVLYNKTIHHDNCGKIKKDNKLWILYSSDMQKAFFDDLNVSCDFEKEGCQWKSSEKGVKAWNIGQGPTASLNTGPSFDHTFKNLSGHYLYFEASWIQGTPRLKNNDRIILESPTILAPYACLKFAYHMFGVDIKGLEVYLNSGIHRKKIWHRDGPLGNKWNSVELDLSINIEYYISIEAVRGNSHLSDIAIDDIILHNGLCSSSKENLTQQCSVTCVDSELMTMLKSSALDGAPCVSAETENSLCLDKKCEPINCNGVIGELTC
ncbi:uncharacterized protein LOC100200388 isoform X3 [Hydra vulgaris]|uniref:Uncharacterized protein LOC100200388 isoform X3 n=1 Tax=Hydra vulgaris TaxID=6087 RepID=A0ABM4D4R8_HYDVU